MPLLECSTAPERCNGDQILPTIPNEIYLHIFEFVVPSNKPMELWDLQMLARLGGVCRFFASACLPRMFEHIKFFSVQIPGGSRAMPHSRHRQLLSTLLFVKLAKNRPDALTLAKSVRILHLENGYEDRSHGWAKGQTPKRYLSCMSYMTNIHQFVLWHGIVDADHWRTIASLPLLEELHFVSCEFFPTPASATLEKMDKLKLSFLEVSDCTGRFQPMAPIDARYLRTLTVDLKIVNDIDWLPQSALMELGVSSDECLYIEPHAGDLHITQMRGILTQIPDSIRTLSFYFYELADGTVEDVVRYLFESPTWTNYHRLRSLKLRFHHHAAPGRDLEVLSTALDGIGRLTGLRSLGVTCTCWGHSERKMPSSEIRSILHAKLDSHSRLTYINTFERALRLVDGEWSEIREGIYATMIDVAAFS